MSALKTVERASDLKLLEKKLNIIMRDISGFIDRQNDINRNIRQVESQLSLLTNIDKMDTTFGGQVALQGEALEKFKVFDKKRDVLLERREVLERDIAERNPELTRKIESVDKRIDKLDREISALENSGGNADEAIAGLNAERDSFVEIRDMMKSDIAKNSGEMVKELENVNKEIDSINKEVGDLIKGERINRDKQIEILTQTHENLLTKRDTIDGRLAESTAKYNEIKGKITDVKRKGLKKPSLGKGLKKLGSAGVGALASVVKSGFNKADPFAKGINKEDVGDTGAEGIRLAKTSLNKVNSGIKTAKNTVKTTNRGIKTVTNATKNTVKAAYRATVKTVKMVYVATKALVTGMIHLVAFLMNPIVLVIIAVLLVAVMLTQAVVVLMGAVAGGGAMVTASGAVGLGNVPESYQQGLTLLNNATTDSQAGFNDLVNAPQYLGNDLYNGQLANSDLVFLRTTAMDGSINNYSTAFATDSQKAMLRNAWNLSLPENEILAIAYVLLQKRANEAGGTVGQVYNVDYTFDIFHEIISLIVTYHTTIHTNQLCPGQNCTIEIYILPNPDYIALEAQIAQLIADIAYYQAQIDSIEPTIATMEADRDWYTDMVNYYNGLLADDPTNTFYQAERNYYSAMRTNVINALSTHYGTRSSLIWQRDNRQFQLANRQTQLANTPETIEVESDPLCNALHTLHAIELRYSTTNTVMNTLGFTDTERQLVSLTILGFENNPNL